jgi:hypothetical protein
MPLQRVVEADALTNQPLAVIDQQPQVELGPFQLRRRQLVEAFAQGRPRDGDRVDAVGLPALSAPTPRIRHQPRRDTQNTFSALDQEALKGSRHMPAVLERPNPLAIQPARPDQQRTEPADADPNRSLAEQLAACRANCGDRV